jgi:uncharacterized protein (TIGR01777 family)
MNILISGSTGLIGKALIRRLNTSGHTVTRLVRSNPTGNDIVWGPDNGTLDASRIEGCEAVVHLAGESIAARRWTAAQKERIRDSRVKGTTLLAGKLATLQHPPRVLVSASAIGYYGNRGAETLSEESGPGSGFLPEVCKAWEAATGAASVKGIRVVNLRTGIVLSTQGGALAAMLKPFRLGVGGKIGNGSQYMSWITLNDLCRAIIHALQTETLRGPVNAVTAAVTNSEFTKALGAALHRPTILPMPAFAARVALGEMADELLLASIRVAPTRLRNSGFTFEDSDLASALKRTMSAGI